MEVSIEIRADWAIREADLHGILATGDVIGAYYL
jgi:hypothetical protein